MSAAVETANLCEQIAALRAQGDAAAGEEAIAAYTAAGQLVPTPVDPDDSDEDDSNPPPREVLVAGAAVLARLAEAHVAARNAADAEDQSTRRGHAMRAVAAGQKAARCDPQNWRGHWFTGLAIMMLQPKVPRSKQAVAAFEAVIKLDAALDDTQKADARRALEAAQQRLQKGRDDLPMPEGCVLC